MSKLNIQLLYRSSKRFPIIIHHLLPDLASGLTLSGSNYPYLEQSFMVPKRFEPSKFDCSQLLPAFIVMIIFWFYLNGLLNRIIRKKI